VCDQGEKAHNAAGSQPSRSHDKTLITESPLPAPAKTKNPFALNPNFNQQTRKMLGKHYRAKFGVK
jgi:hypothetical protein